MTTRWGRHVLAAAILLLGPLTALQAASAIQDNAGLFSAKALEQAAEAIKEIKRQTGRDVNVETFASVPPAQRERIGQMSPAEKREFYHSWMVDRATASQSNGIFILVSKSPGHVEVGHKKGLAGEVTESERTAIRSTMARHFSQKDFDGGLLAGIKAAGESLASTSGAAGSTARKSSPADRHQVPATVPNHPAEEPVRNRAAGGFPWGTLLFVGGLLLIAWIVIGFIRGLFSMGRRAVGMGRDPNSPPPMPQNSPYGYGGGYGQRPGGGMMGNILTGMFGAMAGHWLYDNVFGGHSAHASPTDHSGGGGFFGGGGDGGGDGYISSGSDYSSDAGGDSFASGDFGGDGGGFDSGDF